MAKPTNVVSFDSFRARADRRDPPASREKPSASGTLAEQGRKDPMKISQALLSQIREDHPEDTQQIGDMERMLRILEIVLDGQKVIEGFIPNPHKLREQEKLVREYSDDQLYALFDNMDDRAIGQHPTFYKALFEEVQRRALQLHD